MGAATRVFSIAELLESILLHLPCENVHQEINSIRTIILGQRTCRAWHSLIQTSTPVRKRLYLKTPIDVSESRIWHEKTEFPPAQPNPWIPHLLLNQRSWGSSWPFDNVYVHVETGPSQPRYWTFSIELSRAQHALLPQAGLWREMLVASPPFTNFWYTRCFYELGSGRAPFVTHVDYDPNAPKSEQRYSVHCPEGMTLGHLCDAVGELFEKPASAKFVMVESVRLQSDPQTAIDLSEDRPTTKSYIPGSSAERAQGWL